MGHVPVCVCLFEYDVVCLCSRMLLVWWAVVGFLKQCQHSSPCNLQHPPPSPLLSHVCGAQLGWRTWYPWASQALQDKYRWGAGYAGACRVALDCPPSLSSNTCSIPNVQAVDELVTCWQPRHPQGSCTLATVHATGLGTLVAESWELPHGYPV